MHVPIYTKGSATLKCLCGWSGEVDPDLPLIEPAYLALHAAHRQGAKDYTLQITRENSDSYSTPCALCMQEDRCIILDAGYDAHWMICTRCAQKSQINSLLLR